MNKLINRRCHIDSVEPGMKLAKAILTEYGKVALSEGTILNDTLLNRLKAWNFTYLDICEEIEINAGQKSPSAQQQFFENYDETVTIVKQTFDTVKSLKIFPAREIKNLVNEAIQPMMQSVGVINHLHMVQRQDDYTFHHSVNVSVIAGVIGKWLGLRETEMLDLCLAGLLHDIGKTQIPISILNKPGKLTSSEMNIMRKHTTLGYHLIQHNPAIPKSVGYGVLQHHERSDGTGYPLMIKADKIHLFAKIISVADIYDAMTSDRVYHKKITPFEVVDMLVKEMFGGLDPVICGVFLNNVRDYFVGNILKLGDGRKAEVIYLGHFMGSRPVVRTDDGCFIDLEKNKNISITELVKA